MLIWRDVFRDFPLAMIITVAGAALVAVGVVTMVVPLFGYLGVALAGAGLAMEAIGYLTIRA
jgi:hypothetical protein